MNYYNKYRKYKSKYFDIKGNSPYKNLKILMTFKYIGIGIDNSINFYENNKVYRSNKNIWEDLPKELYESVYQLAKTGYNIDVIKNKCKYDTAKADYILTFIDFYEENNKIGKSIRSDCLPDNLYKLFQKINKWYLSNNFDR